MSATIGRIQPVVLHLLRADTGLSSDFPGIKFGSWRPDIDHRTLPYVNIRRLSGLAYNVGFLDRPTVEMTVYAAPTVSESSLVIAEQIYLDCRQVLFNAKENQTLTPHGYIHSFFETFGPTTFDSPIEDSNRIQGIIQLGLRPL